METPLSLTGNTQIPINITNDAASSASNRFMIVFKPTSTLPVTITNVKAYTKDKGIQVDWTVQTELNIDRYEVEKSGNGTEFVKATSVSAKGNSAITQLYGWLDNNPIVGNNFYRIKVIEKTGAVKYTQIVKVTIGGGEASMSVYPNPVKGKVMNVRLTNMEKAKYTLSLYNNLGQQVYTGIIEHNGGSGTYSISLRNITANGAYKLNIFNDTFKKVETVIFE